MSKALRMLIGGEFHDTADKIDVYNPATGKVVGQVPQIEPDQVALSLKVAHEGFIVWSGKSLAERSEIILRFADLLEASKAEIIDLLIEETGKPADNADYDFGMLTTCLRFFVEESKRTDQPTITDPSGEFLHYVSRQPLGVVVGYLAWNFPLLNLGYKLGPALAAGCSVIVKPSQLTPLASLRCAELAQEAGIPAGVVNVITGDRFDVTDPLLTSDVTSMFTMIGSTKSGVNAMRTASTSVKKFSVELGGNAPVVVYPDADIDKAVADIVDLKLGNSGQVCVSPNRCYVHVSVYDEFLTKAVDRVQTFKLGSGSGEGPLMGPIISAEARDRILDSVKSAQEQGARLMTGGKIPADNNEGYYMEPTVLADVTASMPIACDEIFGPVLPVMKYDDSQDPVALANDNPFGLAAYVYTQNLNNAMRAANEIQAGSVCINSAHYSVQLPHGGLKQSGVGKDCSKYSLEEYLTLKRVSILIHQ
ncbi:aldehyde dehydrogenase family protein [Gilvimarinus agarilyticus]|uniref:aldehyde dehydrogenase family protein n=1 Tax=Gilvimarinus sp. 2_MG-2023 TaxID=3062666 RepID=UPI001C0A20D0|nr:aldehyde dehydrogenase family protein [Gilvimarinus sp. 2_MG-2023]MBU2886384.1 aldehyde dehydrogenase family protein [Gilvimarinus agarilyticus]MDO6571063.1 aldehyde dehydrogenase family protein [Gilvimarinus sp. 2_MG-2023]